MTTRIAIIGVGEVGAAVAYALLLGSVCGELLLVDVKTDLRDGQVRDLADATYRESSGTRIRSATYREAGQCDIVVITAGSKRNIGETSSQTLYRSAATLRGVIRAMKPFRSDTILLVVSNPVDVLTALAQKLSGLPKSQVIGSGTFLDSARLRGLLADKIGVSASSIDAYVLGEHGNFQFVAWSIASIGGIPIDVAVLSETFDRAELAEECKHEGQHIIEAKGAIVFGIGSIVSSLCSSILLDKRKVRPLSHWQEDLGCCLSLPVILGRKGLIRTIPAPLNAEEHANLMRSAKALKQTVETLEEELLSEAQIGTL